jgi:hypothetical protein
MFLGKILMNGDLGGSNQSEEELPIKELTVLGEL